MGAQQPLSHSNHIVKPTGHLERGCGRYYSQNDQHYIYGRSGGLGSESEHQ
jgi:hypothetical protein